MDNSAKRPATAHVNRLGIALAPLVGMALSLSTAGCGRAGGGAATPSAEGPHASETKAGISPERRANHGVHLETSAPGERAIHPVYDEPFATLDTLRRQGRFDEFVDGALNATVDKPHDAALQWLRGEASLACGDHAGAEASGLRAAALALDANDEHLAVRALRIWMTARLRQGATLPSADVEPLLARLPATDDGARLMRFWLAAFAEAKPYEVGAVVDARWPAELATTRAATGTLWAQMNAVQVTANGANLPMVFVDTGAQHTIMTRRAAELAGVPTGAPNAQLIGFRDLDAQPAVLESLELGSLKLRNVPVLVGDSVPLVTAKGQMALGTELMHHVRFTLDYPSQRVWAEAADRPSALTASPLGRKIPLWTFSQACLARGETTRGPARVLIDTGNRAGTYVSARWARHYFPQFRVPNAQLIFKFRNQGLSLDRMELGNAALVNWPILDRLPNDLERLDLMDVLVGREMLWPYRVTIDMAELVMILDGTPDNPTPPTETLP